MRAVQLALLLAAGLVASTEEERCPAHAVPTTMCLPPREVLDPDDIPPITKFVRRIFRGSSRFTIGYLDWDSAACRSWAQNSRLACGALIS